jgi:hypothetical protein
LQASLPSSSPSPFAAPVPAQQPPAPTLYKRLGGYDAMAAVTDDFLRRLTSDPAFARFLQRPQHRLAEEDPSARRRPAVRGHGRPLRLYRPRHEDHARRARHHREGLGHVGQHLTATLDELNVPAKEKDRSPDGDLRAEEGHRREAVARSSQATKASGGERVAGAASSMSPPAFPFTPRRTSPIRSGHNASMRRIALLAGATGLVGRELLPLLLDDGDIEEVVVLSRRALATPHPKLQQGIVAFDQLGISCCRRSTISTAASAPTMRDADRVRRSAKSISLSGHDRANGACRRARRAASSSPRWAPIANRACSTTGQGRARGRADAPRAAQRSTRSGRRCLPANATEVRLARARGAASPALPLSFLLPPRIRPIAAADVARAMHACGRRSAAGGS